MYITIHREIAACKGLDKPQVFHVSALHELEVSASWLLHVITSLLAAIVASDIGGLQ